MPKLKTKKGAAKRFKVTGSGKVKRSKGGRGHLKASKNAKRKRGLRVPQLVSHVEERTIKTLLPYA